jgi:uncharacterized protein YciI
MNSRAFGDKSRFFFPHIGLHYAGTLNKSYSEKNYFVLKLAAPRPSFASDMTDREARVMKEHAEYMKDYVDKGTLIIMGPVFDPNGAWAIALVEAGSEEEVRSVIEKDPTILSGLGFRFEIYPMLRAVARNNCHSPAEIPVKSAILQ